MNLSDHRKKCCEELVECMPFWHLPWLDARKLGAEGTSINADENDHGIRLNWMRASPLSSFTAINSVPFLQDGKQLALVLFKYPVFTMLKLKLILLHVLLTKT